MQFIDDVLDFTSSSGQLGKPSLNDVKSGVITAPVLYAAEQHPELKDMIQRKFKNDGDVSRAIELVFDSDGIQRTRDMAEEHCKLAARTVCENIWPSAQRCCEVAELRGDLQVEQFSDPQSAHARICRQALTEITNRVLSRSK